MTKWDCKSTPCCGFPLSCPYPARHHVPAEAEAADRILPCDVVLPPNTVIRAGVKLSTLHAALEARGMAASSVIAEIAAERRQQVEDGRDASHDDELGQGELALAAAAYTCGDASLWPWSVEWWKPKDRRRNYVRAAALLIAEIERMDRHNAEVPR